MTYYFEILVFSIIIPFIFSFHPKVQFYKKFKILFISIPLSVLPYIIWDMIFTRLGVWGFNPKFTTNIYLYNLPVEEVSFFFVIPFCCLYSYFLIEKYKIIIFKFRRSEIINTFIAIIFFLIGIINYNKIYTFYCFIFCALLVVIETFFIKKINYNIFYTGYGLLFIPFIVINGALTGLFCNQIIVWYNPLDIIGIHIFTIPIEDAIYSFQLLLINNIF